MFRESFRRKDGESNSQSQFGEWKELPVEEFEWFVKELKKKYGMDLTGYKPHRVKRRIEILIKKYGLHSYRDYMRLLETSDKVMNEFQDKLTINVTEFFRNPEKWWQLRDRILPELLKTSGRNFKAWSAGCSSGEEPYSLAILLEELKAPPNVRILATDIDNNMLAQAIRGVYEERSMVNTPKEYIEKYFEIRDGKYYVKPTVKIRVNFKKHNLLQDPFEKDLDLIVCRNVVIYFEMDAKRELYRKFSESLKKNGVLFVGSTERIFNHREIGLEPIMPFFYRKVS